MRYLAIVLALSVAACATPHFVPTLRYTLNPPIEAVPASPLVGTLGIRSLTAARPYKQSVVYRDPDYVLENDSHVEWAELPAASVTRALTDAIVASGRFHDVGDAMNLAVPDYILTGELRKFDLVRTAAPWTAECEVRLELRKGIERQAVWSATLAAQEPLSKNDVSALPEAMSRAVAKLVNQAAADIAKQE